MANGKNKSSSKKTKGKNGAQVKGRKIGKIDVDCFDSEGSQAKKGRGKDYDKQLEGQQNALNNMTVDEYLKGRASFSGKNPCTGKKAKKVSRDGKKAKAAREKETKRLTRNELAKIRRNKGKYGHMTPNAQTGLAKRMAKQTMKGLAALHNPDMIAGGADVLNGAFGNKGVNSSIGSSWKTRVSAMDKAACKARKDGKGKQKMNVNLHRCDNSKAMDK